ncbi:NACHT, LRR and PYD domains-containing protein 3-like [Triplophysa dalaica]|uniref:NACHT, LRR and PYD domains-containing protein 3-like n=1 Tax=Triplophysa dalaica TaxID=1582913 RepID=UPI0024DF734B|nr:NACHT, LRR and PYD domains-containing protein 3-like [Triplophysa dalaica]
MMELLKNSLNDLRKDELKEFQWHLRNDYKFPASGLVEADVLDTVDKMVEREKQEGAVNITLDILKKINQNQLAEELEKKLKVKKGAVDSKAVDVDYSDFSNKLKKLLKQDYEKILDGNSHQNTYLTDIYTDLYIVKNHTGGVVNEHEVRQIESNRTAAEDTSVMCNDIFKVQRDTGRQNRKVLTLGIAGVGKTVSVSKFILDWAEGKENQEIIFIFPLAFRELNLISVNRSLMGLINKKFFGSENQLSSLPKEEGKVMFIFDGLDECRFSLSFKNREGFTDVTKETTVDVIITNLIEKNLIPSALIWITSRPAAAHLIPPEHIDQVTEIRGFNDEQKEKYFTRNSKPEMSERIISHIKRSRSLHIMCHIPVFCWICLSVLQPLMMTQENLQSIPTTLTGMYIYFLLSQMKQMKAKKQSDNLPQSFEDVVLKLGKLAFTQLQKGNLIFYKEDLEECELYVDDGIVFSGLCTQMFQAEKPVSGRKVFSFVHLSVQEFLAALYVLFIYKNRKTNPFPLTLGDKIKRTFKKNSLVDLHKTGIKNALQSKNGHLDLLLRFLMGLSLESNQNELKDLLPSLNITAEDMRQTCKYIKQKIKNEESSEKTINLFHCLNELGDDSLITEIQKYLNSEGLSARKLSSGQWSALVFVLLMSEETQEMFEMQKYRRSDEAVIRLLPVIRNTRRALLQNCNLTDECCERLSSCLQSSTSLRELDLSNNDLEDSGVKLISDALKTHNCQLHTLRFSLCNVTEECCVSLSSCLQSSSSLRELDLSNNDLKDSGVKLISGALKTHNCQLQTLRLSLCNVTEECCVSLSSCLQSSTSLRELDLSNNDLKDSGVKLISDALKTHNCQLHTLRLSWCNVTEECCVSLSSCLQSSTSLRELDLSNNDLKDSGVKLISDALKTHNCQLHTLRLSGCMVTDEGCCSLASALSSQSSHLRELDLSYNHPQHTTLQLLSHTLNDPNYTINVSHGGETRIRAGLHKYVCDLTLDLNTTHTKLKVSEENRKITRVRERQSYPDHPDRFDVYPQVLCRESLTGWCYWETEWSGSFVHISVSYKSIKRKGESYDCVFGFNVKSWSLFCSDDTFTAVHNNKQTHISVSPGVCKRAGVYVDQSAGTLSFYSVSDTHTITHLHTYYTTFTEPLCAGFGVYECNSSVCLCDINSLYRASC